ncbi:MAG: ABC transporter permease [Candidatus Moraniibacteriota bacterium]
MRLWDIIKLSLRMFRARTMRTILTVLGMGLGIAAILFFVSIGYGLQRTLLEKITTADSLVTLDVANNPSKNALITSEKIAEFEKLPGVVETSPAMQLRAQAKLDNITLDVSATGTTSAFLKLAGSKPLVGTLLDDAQPQNVVITQGIAQTFEKTPAELIGKKLSVRLFSATAPDTSLTQKNTSDNAADIFTFTVGGVIEGTDNLLYFSLKAIPDISFDTYSQLKIKNQSSATMTSVRDTVIGQGFSVSSLSDTVAQANKVFSAVQLTLMFFGFVALSVSAIGMFNTMTIALLERTEEIGIMKSIGASRNSISLMFIMESTIMGLLGALGGVVISYLGGFIVNSLLNVVAARFGGQAINLFYSPLWFVFTIIGFGAFVGLLTGVFPARSASRIDPLEALRYK